MPTVPQYERQIRDAALPAARITPSADLEAFGGGQSFQQATNAIQSYVLEEKKKADDIATTDAYAKAVQARNKLINDPSQGIITLKGKNAIGASEKYGEMFGKEMDFIEGGLANEDQRALFRQIRQTQSISFDSDVQKHVYAETQRYDQETTMSAIAAARDDAILNYRTTGSINQSLNIQMAAIDTYSARNGLSPEATKVMLSDAISSTHSGVIERMLNNNQDRLAKEYFNEVRDSMTGKDVSKIEKVVEAGSLLGESQRKEDEIMGLGLSHQEALLRAREIEDPEMRDSVKKRIDARYSELADINRQQKEALYKQASDIAEITKKRPNATIWAQLSLTERNAIDSRIEQISGGKGVSYDTNWQAYYDLKNLASSDITRKDFLKTNLLTYRSKLGDTEFKELMKLQADMRNGDEKAVKAMRGYRTETDIVNNTLRSIGISKGDNRYLNANRQIDQLHSEFVSKNKRKPDNNEFQKLVDEVIMKVEMPGKFYGITKRRVFEISVKDIPVNERKLIEAELKRQKRPVTDDLVLRYYQAMQVAEEKNADK